MIHMSPFRALCSSPKKSKIEQGNRASLRRVSKEEQDHSTRIVYTRPAILIKIRFVHAAPASREWQTRVFSSGMVRRDISRRPLQVKSGTDPAGLFA